MVHLSTSLTVTFLLVASAIAIPVDPSKSQNLQLRTDDIEARDPSFGSFFRKIRKVVNPSNLKKVASVASFVIRDNDVELSARDIDYFEDLAVRDPSFKSFFKKVKNFFSPQHIDKAANTAKEASKLAGMLRRSDAEDISERGLDEEDDIEAFTAREMEDLEELAVRDPSFGSFFRKVKKFANMKNIKKVASVASLVIREDDEIFEREFVDMMELDQLD